MFDSKLLPDGFNISEEDLENTPPCVLALLSFSLEQNIQFRNIVIKLESRLNLNSTNSSRPPSSDNKLKKRHSDVKTKKRAGGKPGHKGHRQQLLKPTDVEDIVLDTCSCGNTRFDNDVPFYTHQHLELPEIKLVVTHFILHRGVCTNCGKVNKTFVPPAFRAGYGPRLTAVIAELDGNHGDSRSIIQNFCASVLGFSISLGAIQKVLDRASAAIGPHYQAIGTVARRAPVNHFDETSWFQKNDRCWLWVMANTIVAFFMIHQKWNAAAFKALIKDWCGILISDGYRVYTQWVGLRQSCLAHLSRDAKGLAESTDPSLASFGKIAHPN